MKKQPLWRISVTTSAEAEDAVAELLQGIFTRPAATYTNEETKVGVVSVYCQKRSEWTPRKKKELAGGLKQIQAGGLNIGAATISATKVAHEDWSESWKRHFKPISIGTKLLVKPSWIKRRPLKNQSVVILDPGLSFGTGNHPTTSFCLHELARHRDSAKTQSFWDIGTGSGILAIAAVKLGYTPVKAIDFDPEAIRVARQNAIQNAVSKQLQITRQDITKLPAQGRDKYDLICANLISNLLIAEKKRIINRLRTGGILVLAGILKEEFFIVQQAFEKTGLRLTSSRIEGEWRSGSFAFA
jgi:ribosomal protein L11 methyltransferase